MWLTKAYTGHCIHVTSNNTQILLGNCKKKKLRSVQIALLKQYLSTRKGFLNWVQRKTILQQLRLSVLTDYSMSIQRLIEFVFCLVSQSLAMILLEQLEREKDILRIFLKVCQDEHPILRRMHLKSFLMVPVQRIMK